MFLSDPLDCNSSDVTDFEFWSFCKLDADRAPKFVSAPITTDPQNTKSTARSVMGTSSTIEIAMTGDDALRVIEPTKLPAYKSLFTEESWFFRNCF